MWTSVGHNNEKCDETEGTEVPELSRFMALLLSQYFFTTPFGQRKYLKLLFLK